jgi:ferredoxin
MEKFRIGSGCIACGACVDECPKDAISEGDIYVIDRDRCEGCAKCGEICPVDACRKD